MSDPNIVALAQRLDRLERRVRWWRGLTVLSGAIVALLTLWGVGRTTNAASAAVPRLIEAEQIVVRDANGRPRVLLGTTNAGAGLTLTDERGVIRASLLMGGDGTTFLWLHPESGRPGVMLNAAPVGSVITLNHEDESSKVALANLRDGHALLRLYDGADEVTLSAHKAKSGLLMKGSAHERGSATLTFNEGSPVLYLRDPFDNFRVMLGSTPQTTGNVWGLGVADANGKTLLFLP